MPNDKAPGAIPDPTDPFDIDALRANPLQDLNTEKMLTTVPVRRPGKTEFVRVHRSDDYSIDCYLFERKPEGGDRETFWVAPPVRFEITEGLTLVRLCAAITKSGVTFLWPARLPSAEANSGQQWHVSALEAVDVAKDQWIRVFGNKALGAYEIVRALGDFGEPKWPDKTLKELITIAFKDRIITSLDHPALKELRGEI